MVMEERIWVVPKRRRKENWTRKWEVKNGREGGRGEEITIN